MDEMLQQNVAHPPLDLGWFMLCLGVEDLAASLDFYSRLGFMPWGGKAEEGWISLANGTTELGLYSFFRGPLLNFRGADARLLARQLAERGVQLEDEAVFDPAQYPNQWWQDEKGESLPMEGSGSVMSADPDGNAIFIDTVPVERRRLLAGESFCIDGYSGKYAADQPRLGRMSYCLNCADLGASLDYYLRLGLSRLGGEESAGWAIMGDPQRNCSIGLFKGHISSNLLNFRGADIFRLAAELAERGLSFAREAHVEADGSSAAELLDPDGNVIYLNTAPGESPA